MLDPRKEASEAIKDLMVSEKRSKLPLILAVLVVIALLAGGGYWYTLPPEKRPSLDDLIGRMTTVSNKMLNTPIMNTPAPAPTAPTAPTTTNKTAAPSSSKDGGGLLSN